MALKQITKASEPLAVHATIVCLYGYPGSGKTSIASTAAHPLLLDFDRGSHRSAFRPDTIQVESWGDVAHISCADLAGYSTLIVDTAGRALDFLAAAMPASEGKSLLKLSSGRITQQGYGYLKDSFVRWLRLITTFGLDVVLICHDKEEKDGDNRIIRPDITGGSYHEIVKVSDFVGYVGKLDGRNTILDFNPTSQWIGKNSAGFDPLAVPDFADEPEWFAGIVARMKSSLGNIAKRQREALEKLAGFKAKVEQVKSVDDYNTLIGEAQALGKPLNLQAWNALRKAAESDGMAYDKEAKRFVEPEQPEPQEDQAEGGQEAREAA